MEETKTKGEGDYLINDNLSWISEWLLWGIAFLNVAYLPISRLVEENNNINSANMDIVNNILAPLIVGLLTAAFGWLWSLRKLKEKIEAAPERYVRELDKLIKHAIEEGEENALLNARAIVSARNSLRESLVSISKHLNSEIDQLAIDIGQVITPPLGPSNPASTVDNLDAKRTYETIIVLSKIWPAKRGQIKYEVRKVLNELGL